MDGLIIRLAVIVATRLPSTECEIANVLGEWKNIMSDINKEKGENDGTSQKTGL